MYTEKNMMYVQVDKDFFFGVKHLCLHGCSRYWSRKCGKGKRHDLHQFCQVHWTFSLFSKIHNSFLSLFVSKKNKAYLAWLFFSIQLKTNWWSLFLLFLRYCLRFLGKSWAVQALTSVLVSSSATSATRRRMRDFSSAFVALTPFMESVDKDSSLEK